MKLPGSRGLFVAGVGVLFAVSFQAGRSGADCFHDCYQLAGNCIYNGSTGQILKATSACTIKAWAPNQGGSGSCSGSQTCSALTCVGAGTYCHAPGSGEYALMGFDCGSCSGSTTFSGCGACY